MSPSPVLLPSQVYLSPTQRVESGGDGGIKVKGIRRVRGKEKGWEVG